MGAIAINSGLTDVLAVVCEYVYAFAQIPIAGIPQLTKEQIIRGWQALGIAPAADEVCIVTLLSSVRTSFDSPSWAELSSGDSSEPSLLRVEQRLEHSVQIDFAALSQRIDPSVTKRRADQIYMISHSNYAAGFFHSHNPRLSCLYCDPPSSLGELDGAHALKHRHIVTLHVSESQVMTLPVSTFERVSLYTENVLVHHKFKRI